VSWFKPKVTKGSTSQAGHLEHNQHDEQRRQLFKTLGMCNDPGKDAVEVNYVPGYPSLAAFIASDPDHGTAVYRRFDRLSARNLLYVQAELVTLEKKQDELDQHDLNSDNIDAKDKARNWETLLTRAESGSDDEAKERVQVAKGIREKIKEYSQCFELWRDPERC